MSRRRIVCKTSPVVSYLTVVTVPMPLPSSLDLAEFTFQVPTNRLSAANNATARIQAINTALQKFCREIE